MLIDEAHDFAPEARNSASKDKDEDGIPLIIRLPTLRDEAQAIADQLANAHQEGHASGDMTVLCPDRKTRDLSAQVLRQRGCFM